jgi:hypothetical protein
MRPLAVVLLDERVEACLLMQDAGLVASRFRVKCAPSVRLGAARTVAELGIHRDDAENHPG